MVVEARPSAGGSIGAAHVARSPADGYTLLLATLSHVTNPGLTAGKSTWHPADDFSGMALREAAEEVGLAAVHVEVLGTLPVYTTVTAFEVTPVVALVPASLPVRTLKEFVE